MRFTGFVVVPLAILTACTESSQTLTAPPSPTPNAPPPALPSLSGTVVEWTPQGERPLAEAFVWGFYHDLNVGPLLRQVRADEFGRYELTLEAGARFQVLVTKQGYVQQCAQEIIVGETSHLNLPLIAETNLSSSRDSVPPSRPGFRMVTGLVYEANADGRRPLPNRFVFYDWGLDAAAYTRTDNNGRFLMCGLPQSRTVWIAVDSSGLTWATVPAGGDTDIEIEVEK